MGVHSPFVGTANNTAFITITTTVESIFASTPIFVPPADGALILVVCTFTFQAGTGTTGVNYVIRRGTTVTSPAVWARVTQDFIVGSELLRTITVVDTVPTSAPTQYSASVTQTAATANGTVVAFSIAAMGL